MLVTFSCPAYADITLFGDVALRLLKMMGHSGTVPSALLARLEAAIETEKQSSKATEVPAADNDEEPAISLTHRALPLIELLKAAAKDKCNVMWSSGT